MQHQSTLPQSSAIAPPDTSTSALLTDLYQLTMAQNYWRLQRHEQKACCQLFFREHPFAGKYTVNAGLQSAVDYLQNWHFNDADIDYLASLQWPNKTARFDKAFLKYLKTLRFSGDLYAIDEGSLVFPQQPLLRIEAPIIQTQLLETALINAYSFACLVATKAHRICQAAGEAKVSEFGLRRAQGPNGGLTASRAAYLGGVSSTSNVLAGQRYAIPVLGTMSHSWVMSFADEAEAFQAAAQCMGENNVLLVDTYDTLHGLELAIQTAHRMQTHGHQLAGIRLDSGDLAELSKRARQRLDAAGLHNTKIMASGNIDEHVIASLQQQQAKIDAWGVGTRLAVADGAGALNIAYKLSAIAENNGNWRYCRKRSNTLSKRSFAGRIQVARQHSHAQAAYTWSGDILYDVSHPPQQLTQLLPTQAYTPLLKPVFTNGKLCCQQPTLQKSREHLQQQFSAFSPWLAASDTPYPVSIDTKLQQLNDAIFADPA